MLEKSNLIMNNTMDIILLMPFIRMKNVPFSHRLKLDLFRAMHPFSTYLSIGIIKAFFALPHFVKEAIGKVVLDANLSEVVKKTIVLKLLVPRIVSNFLCMGLEEIREVPKNEELIMRTLERYSRKPENASNGSLSSDTGISNNSNSSSSSLRSLLHVLYTTDDVWAPEEDIPFLKNQLKPNSDSHSSVSIVSHSH
jgi:hypothetical protein